MNYVNEPTPASPQVDDTEKIKEIWQRLLGVSPDRLHPGFASKKVLSQVQLKTMFVTGTLPRWQAILVHDSLGRLAYHECAATGNLEEAIKGLQKIMQAIFGTLWENPSLGQTGKNEPARPEK